MIANATREWNGRPPRTSETTIEERMVGLKDVLERRTEQSALLLRRLLGEIRLEPSRPVEGKPYYMARTSLNTLALLDLPSEAGSLDGGSNSLRWWRK